MTNNFETGEKVFPVGYTKDDLGVGTIVGLSERRGYVVRWETQSEPGDGWQDNDLRAAGPKHCYEGAR